MIISLPEYSRLLTILNQARITVSNPALYQFLKTLLESIKDGDESLTDAINELEKMIGEDIPTSGGGGGLGNHFDAPLSDGDLTEANLIYASGECIIVQVPI